MYKYNVGIQSTTDAVSVHVLMSKSIFTFYGEHAA